MLILLLILLVANLITGFVVIDKYNQSKHLINDLQIQLSKLSERLANYVSKEID